MSKRSGIELLYGVLALVVPAWGTHAADETATRYIEMSFENGCDDNNKLMVLENRHDFKTIAVTLRWSAWKGETLTQEVFAMPRTATEIGCAAMGEILRATFTDF